MGALKPLRPLSRWLRFLVWLLIPLLLWWSLRSLSIEAVVDRLAALAWWQAAAFLLTNAVLVGLFALRWRVLVHPSNPHLTTGRLAGYWLAGFGVDYTTPGPGIGGEPLLASLLTEWEDLRGPAAAAAVGVDRLVDATVNFAVLFLAALLILRWHVFHHHILFRTVLVPAAFLLLLGLLMGALWRGDHPLRRLAERLPGRSADSPLLTFLLETEDRLVGLLQRQPRRLALALSISLGIWVGFFGEFWLLVHFLGLDLSPPELVTALTAYRLAFLLPLPAGLGALEASQVFTFRALGLDPTIALGATLMIRARDLLFAAAGLGWGAWLVGGWGRFRRRLLDGSAPRTSSGEGGDLV